MSPRARVIRGVGREVNPIDGDKVVIELGVRDGKIAGIEVIDIRTGAMTWVNGEVSFATGAEARVHGDTFAGCEIARRAALVLPQVFVGREIEESLSIGASEIIAKMDAPPENERCVMTVLSAVRNALIDIQVTILAEAIVEVRRMRETA